MIALILYLFSFIRTLFVFVILYLIIRWFRNLLAPKPNNNQQSRSNTPPSSKEGETIIRYNNKGEKIVDKNKGEYVDFEEVD